jgi:hypothetical protein
MSKKQKAINYAEPFSAIEISRAQIFRQDQANKMRKAFGQVQIKQMPEFLKSEERAYNDVYLPAVEACGDTPLSFAGYMIYGLKSAETVQFEEGRLN